MCRTPTWYFASFIAALRKCSSRSFTLLSMYAVLLFCFSTIIFCMYATILCLYSPRQLGCLYSFPHSASCFSTISHKHFAYLSILSLKLVSPLIWLSISFSITSFVLFTAHFLLASLWCLLSIQMISFVRSSGFVYEGCRSVCCTGLDLDAP